MADINTDANSGNTITHSGYYSNPATVNQNWGATDGTSVRWLAMVMHNYFKNTFGYSAMDYQMGAYIYEGLGTNGAADGTNILFGSQDGQEWARSSGVVYHEYTHDVVYHIYGEWIGDPNDGTLQGSAMDEGFADYFAGAKNNDSNIMEDIQEPGLPRHLQNTLKYPDNYRSDDPHWNGQIIGGACWDTRQAVGSTIGNNLAFRALQISPQAHNFSDFLQNMLIADNNYYSGSYNSQITTAFANHGISAPPPSVSISGPQYVYPNMYPTWTANVSGGISPYQYYWQENDHYRDGSTSGWQYFGNLQSEGRTWQSDIERVDLQVRVTDAGSNQATTSFTSYFEQSNTPVTSLSDPTPNPFNPTTVLNYSLATPAHVKLMIYNILGQQVATLVDANQTAGKYRKMFNASQLASGTYLERMVITDKSGKVTQMTRKMLLMK